MASSTSSDDLDELAGIELVGSFAVRPVASRRPSDSPSFSGAHPLSATLSGGLEAESVRAAHRYLLNRRLGGGAQGVVFLATRVSAEGSDAVVIKIWRPSFVSDNPDLAQMVLQKESVALARLNERIPPTPFVVRLLDGGEITVGRRFGPMVLPWLALEYVHGGVLGTTLGDRVKASVNSTGFAFGPARTRRLLEAVVRGLSAIHEEGVVHRDLKPTNVLMCGMDDDELAKVADFGMARPMGLKITFGDSMAVGTPGYAAPEQFENSLIGPWSDVFALGALAYFAIAGEDMFSGPPTVQMAHAYSGKYEPLPSRPHLHPSWRNLRGLPRLEAALARATKRDLQLRTPSVAEFWAAVEPAIIECETSGLVSVAAASAKTLRDAAAQPWSFQVSHVPKSPIALRAVAFDPDGHALGVAEDSFWYWEGAGWIRVKPPPGLPSGRVRVLKRLGPGRWFACGDAGLVCVFSPDRCEVLQHMGEVSFGAACVVSERHFALVGKRPGDSPVLYVHTDGAWTTPRPIEEADAVHSIAIGADQSMHLAGRDRTGRGLLASLRADDPRLTVWPIESAPLWACAIDSSGALYAVGTGGFAFRKRDGHPMLERVLSHRELRVLAIDPANGIWAAAAGRILRRPPGAEAATWTPVWSASQWERPFVAIAAFSGMVVAAAEDGSMVTGHQAL